MSAVDVCTAPAMAPLAESTAAMFSCHACAEVFATACEHGKHWKSERHVYNTKRRLAGLKPISQEAWDRKVKEARAAGASNKGTAHLKASKDKAPRKNSGEEPAVAAADAPEGAFAPPARDRAASGHEPEETEEFSPLRCLFDKAKFENLEDNLKYMRSTYDFYIPDREYCSDVEGLLKFLWTKTHSEPHGCLFCNKKFPDWTSCRRHMVDKKHTRIGSEAITRKGFHDEAGSIELQAEIEEFFDFHGSTREVTERIQDPLDKCACLVRFFDEDRDDRLKKPELQEMWRAVKNHEEAGKPKDQEAEAEASDTAAIEEPVLTEAMWQGACAAAEVEPYDGFDAEALLELYEQGFADLDAHFRVLQDLLANKLRRRKEERKAQALEPMAEGDDEDGADEADDGEGSEEEDDDAEVLEVDDEEEFEEVMRVLGLQKATIEENGDLRLPNGNIAVHREMAHIWKQRIHVPSHGPRQTDAAHNGQKNVRGASGPARTAPMLTNKIENCGTLVAFSNRQQAREGKRIIVMMHKEKQWNLQMGMKNNGMQRKCLKIRTGFGDASGGR